MCGIAGFAGSPTDGQSWARLTDVIRHRGPDDQGAYIGEEAYLGMRRLSIIDLEGGHQPMYAAGGALVIVFNGEIYNYRELRRDLEARGHALQTHSDTEVLLKLYEERGADCLSLLKGMFAFAIYDSRSRELFLARDRMGVKPLYYAINGGRLAFGSEIKSILEMPGISRAPNPRAIDAYLTYRYVPGPETLFEGISKFPAGHFGRFRDGKLKLSRYWAPPIGASRKRHESDSYYQDRFAELFEASVRKRMISDVPVGAFLSGGLDSSAIVAAMSRNSSHSVRTFSVGFEWAQDELSDARFVADKLGCEHEEIVCRPSDMELLPKIVWHLDEPIGDAIVVPMYLLARQARKKVKVVLSGEGADEILAGYFPHKVMLWSQLYRRTVPGFVRRNLVKPMLAAMPSSALNAFFDYPADLGNRGKAKLLSYVDRVESGSLWGMYDSLISLFDPDEKMRAYTPAMRAVLSNHAAVPVDDHPFGHGAGFLEDTQLLQYVHWLQDDILNKQDKMTMACSIEGREPFMDHELVEFMAGVPRHLKLRWNGTNKVLLRDYLARVLPPEVARRRKKPFYIPMDKYLGTPVMREMIGDALSEATVRKRGFLDPEFVRDLREKTLKGEFVYDKQVFSLLCLELWFRAFIDR